MIAATAEIDISALQHNFTCIKNITPHAKVLSVLKANAYGHGLVEIAKHLPSADAFGVARFDEAITLRNGGITKPIVLLEGYFNPEELPILAEENIHTVIHRNSQLDELEGACLAKPIHVWLKVDTGMHRLGVQMHEASDAIARLQRCANVHDTVVVMTHFCCADDLHDTTTVRQIDDFSTCLQGITGVQKSLANSAGIIGWPTSHEDWSRPGLLLYGVSPMLNQPISHLGFRPVMTLRSSIIAIQFVKAGESIGYGSAWTATQDTRIGIVAIGYGDGYPRHAKSGTPVLVNGQLVELAGRVSMDMLSVDLGMEGEFRVGDCVTLWGKGLPVEGIAAHSDTIPYELLCNVARRVVVDYVL